MLEVLHPRCAGLDLHKKLIVASRIIPGPDGKAIQETRSFSTMTDGLLALSDWLTAGGCTHVAMESTGVYWKPVYNLLEGNFALLLANAAHVKQVAGRKSDVKDAEWLAQLLRHGLVPASFVPDRDQRELRELTRYRTQLVRERAAEQNRLHKTLEGANVKLGMVATDLLGVSAREMLAALCAGRTDLEEIAQLARGRLREKMAELERALAGRFQAHQQFLVARQLAHIDYLEGLIGEVTAEIGRRLPPPPPGGPTGSEAGATRASGAAEGFAPPPVAASPATEPRAASGAGAPSAATAAAPVLTLVLGGSPAAEEARRRRAASLQLLLTIPGVGPRTAEILVAEIGTQMERFPSAGHLCSWAGLVPRMEQSAGKRKSVRLRKGSPWLRAALVEAAQAAGRTKGTALGAEYYRLAARRGKKKAVIAVAHTILATAYSMLRDGTLYEERGDQAVGDRARERRQQRYIRGLEQLGLKVTVEPALAA